MLLTRIIMTIVLIKVIVIICYLHVPMPLLETIKHQRNPFSLNIYKKGKVGERIYQSSSSGRSCSSSRVDRYGIGQ